MTDKPRVRKRKTAPPQTAADAVVRAMCHPSRWWVDIDPKRLVDEEFARQVALTTGTASLPHRIRQITSDLSKRAIRLSMHERARIGGSVKAARKVRLDGKFLDAIAACSFLRNPHTLAQSLALATMGDERLWIEFDASHFDNGRYDMVGYLVERDSDDGRKWSVNAFSTDTGGSVAAIPFVTCFSVDPIEESEIPDRYEPMDIAKRGLPSDSIYTGLGMAFNEETETRFLVPAGFEKSIVLCESTLVQGAFGSTLDAFESYGMSGQSSLPARLLSEAGFMKWVLAAILVSRGKEDTTLSDADLEPDGGTLDGVLGRLGVTMPDPSTYPGPGWANVEDPNAPRPATGRLTGSEEDRPVRFRGAPATGINARLRQMVLGY